MRRLKASQLLHRASRDPPRVRRARCVCQLLARCSHRTSAFRTVARQRGTRAAHSAQLRRSSLRCDCLAVLGLVAPPRNSLRSLRSLRSNRRGESVDEARCARRPRRCAPRRPTVIPRRVPPAAKPPVVVVRTHTTTVSAKVRPGRRQCACEAPRSAGCVAARASALRHLTRRVCLSAVSAANVASYATGPRARASQGSRCTHRPPRRSAAACPGAPLPRRTTQNTCPGARLPR